MGSELTPPASLIKTPEATMQLFSVIHGLRAARHIKDRILGRAPVISFEITSTRRDGIRYLLQVELSYASNVQKSYHRVHTRCQSKRSAELPTA